MRPWARPGCMSTCTSEAGGCAPSRALLARRITQPIETISSAPSACFTSSPASAWYVPSSWAGSPKSSTALACRSSVKPLRSRPKSSTCGRPLTTVTVVGAYSVVVMWPPGATYSRLRLDPGLR